MSAVPDTVRQLRAGMHRAGLDAVVATTPDNVTYVAGFTVPSHLSNRFRRTLCLLPLDGDPALVVVTVEETMARDSTRWIQEIHAYNEFADDPFAVLAQLIRERRLEDGRIGIEMDHVAADDYDRLRRHLPAARFSHAGPAFLEARMHKTPAEVQALHRGGVQRLYVGNLKAGEHELVAFFTGQGPHTRDYKRGATVKFEKGTDPKYIELRIRDSTGKLQPEFDVKVWQ
ncbi:MAG: aminopeptidase P family N-terminal domain-containing protein [Dehalococcoidia bacterium]|nr:aminopeptidase P family N-terminal domain-containing protein [Dehalococcoidia bacterium]